MTKIICILLIIGISAVGISGCSANKQVKQSTANETSKKAQYACPMKCHVSDKPGKCPVCGMKMKKL